MTAALTWLNDLVQWLGRWIPRLVLIEPTHRGVLFGPRGSARAVGPGLVVYWPITHALFQLAVTTQSLQLTGQILPIPQVAGELLPRVMVCGVSVQFKVDDPVAAATRALHMHALIQNRVQAAIAAHYEVGPDRGWMELAEQEVAGILRPFGIVLERLDLAQHGAGMALKNLADWAYADNVNGTRPT